MVVAPQQFPDPVPVHDLIAAQAVRTPDAVAVVTGETSLTYAALETRACHLAAALRGRGVEAETLVGVCLERGVDLVVALLAVLKAGGAYMPLDWSYPASRLAFMLQDSQARVVVTHSTLAGHLPAGDAELLCLDHEWPAPLSSPTPVSVDDDAAERLAYVIYTSGSTGRPKGVMLPHRAVVNYLEWMRAAFAFTDTDRFLQKTPVSFDISVWELFLPLTLGARLVMLAPGARVVPDELVAAVKRHGITVLQVVPAQLKQLLELGSLDGCTTLSHVFAAGEVLPAALVREWTSRFTAPLHNLYGPSETCIASTSYTCGAATADDPSIPIGRPIANTDVHVLDEAGDPVVPGTSGEIYIGGQGLARGYWQRPDLTAERFIVHPLAVAEGGRLYRTGDRGRWRADGELEFLGRLDHQVKLRGFRIELGEVEAALVRHGVVRDAVAILDDRSPGDARLVAYLVLRPGRAPATREMLVTHLRESLPDYMVPSAFIVIETLPLTPNGKADRNALPGMQGDLLEPVASTDTPRTEAEATLARLYAESLGVDRVGMHDNFFDLGGHSLSATRLMMRASVAFSVELPLRDIFECPTVSQLIARVESRWAAGPSTFQPPTVIEAPHRVEGVSHPLSFAQRRLWLLDQLEPDSAAYVASDAFSLRGRLDAEALRLAFETVLLRHAALRTCFVVTDDEPFQVVREPRPFELESIDLGSLSAEAQTSEVLRQTEEYTLRPFDLTRDQMLRARCLRLSADEHVLIVSVHHIATDGWSAEVLWREVQTLYAAFASGRPHALPDLPLQYADFTAWQRGWLQGDRLDRQLQYWRAQLRGLAPLELPADRPRPPLPSYRGQQCRLKIDRGLSGALRALGRQQGATLFMTLTAAFQLLLARRCRRTDVAIGTPIANRQHRDLDGMIGFFVNTLVLRTDVASARSFRDLVGIVRRVALEAYAHQDLPFERVVEELRPRRDLSRNPLVQVLFGFDTTGAVDLKLRDLAVTRIHPATHHVRFDLECHVREAVDGSLDVAIVSSADLFEPATIASLAHAFHDLLAALVVAPDAPMALVDPPSVDETLRATAAHHEPGATALARETASELLVVDLIDAQARLTPEAAAIVAGDRVVSYAALVARAGRLADSLRRQGIRHGDLIGLCLDRSAETLVTVLGVLRAGAVCLPLDPSHPTERLARIIDESQTSALLIDAQFRDRLPSFSGVVLELEAGAEWLARAGSRVDAAAAVGGDDAGPVPIRPDDLAYVLYTSGSTGTPKGVAMPHRALANLMHWHRRHERLGIAARTLQFAPLSFDVAFQEMLTTWTTGGALVVAASDVRRDSEMLWQVVIQHRVERLFLPYVALRALAGAVEPDAVRAATDLADIVSAGETLHLPDAIRGFVGAMPRCRLHNHYGPTESHVVTTYMLPEAVSTWPATAPIGWPIDSVDIHLLDDAMQPVLVDMPGEIHIAGAALAAGYLHRPDLTAARFVPNPFVPGARVYKTGDLARRRPDGLLEFIGRLDHQIKIRGHRVELEEVEAALVTHAGVRQCAVTVQGGPTDDGRLVAYVVTCEAEPPTREVLQRYLQVTLPDYMVPSVFVVLPFLPLSPNGKVNRRVLPPVEEAGTTLVPVHVAPRTEAEQRVADIWADALSVVHIGRHDNFFEMGGHSFLAAQVVARLRRAFDVDLRLLAMFEHPTVAQLTAHLVAATPRPAGPSDTRLSVQAAHAAGPAPLSFAQQRLWFLDRLQPGTAAYHLVEAWRLRGPLDLDALSHSVNAIVDRHATLRTTFEVIEDQPRQIVHPAEFESLPLVDLTCDPEAAPDVALTRLISTEMHRPFDLVRDRLLRARLFKLAADEHVLVVVMHHIASDGWSLGLFRDELRLQYSARVHGGVPILPALPMTYADFASWQREALQGAKLTRALDYWRRQVADLVPLELPTDHPRPAMPSYRGESQRVVIDPATASDLRSLGRQEQATLFMTLAAAFQMLLARYSGEHDVAVGVPIANRQAPELEPLIGMFVNTLVLRTSHGGRPTFRELLSRVRRAALDAYEHQDLPFERLVEDAHPERDLRRNPLIQILFGLQNVPQPTGPFAGLEVTSLPISEQRVRCDLELLMDEQPDGSIEGDCIFATDLFEPATIERMAGHFGVLLRGLIAAPGVPVATLPMLTAFERQQILVDWNKTASPLPRLPVHRLFEAQAARSPDAIALVWRGESLTYAGLNRRANQVARLLTARGIASGALVAVALPRSIDAIVSLVAILKAGAAYLPLDPKDPAARLRQLLEASGASAMVCDPRLDASVGANVSAVIRMPDEAAAIAAQPDADLDLAVAPDDLAYVMYTSGSTGAPKGVEIPHRAIVRLVCADVVPIAATDVVLQLAPLAFDASTFEIWSALLRGARVVIYPEQGVDLASLESVLRTERISHLWLTASLFNALIDSRPEALGGLSWLLVGGEALSVPHVRRALDLHPGLQMLNGYGPTEVTTFSCVQVIERPCPPALRSIPIGRPIGNTTAYVLDAARQPVPAGVPGTLHLGGAGLARGYRHDAERTAERFIANPFVDGERLYDTGDRVRYLADGALEFLGRTDRQLKLRGFRIELGEIEQTLATHAQVHESLVVVREDQPGRPRLVAYVVAGGEHLSVTELQALARHHLPAHMIPAAFVVLPVWPLTSNGKIDRAALPAPSDQSADLRPGRVAPCGTTELHLIKIWEDLLQLDSVGVQDNFFAIGGHSLLAAQMMDRIERVFDRRLPLDILWFGGGTIEAIARALQDEMASGPELVLMKKGTRRPLFVVHTRGGHLFHYDRLVGHLSPDQTIYGLQARGVYSTGRADRTVEAIASHCIVSMRSVQPEGPYLIAGFSSGGVVAFEMAQQLTKAGQEVGLLALLDTFAPKSGTGHWWIDELTELRRRRPNLGELAELARFSFWRLLRLDQVPALRTAGDAHRWAHWRYRPRPYPYPVDLVMADDSADLSGVDGLGWKPWAAGGIRIHRLPGGHGGLVKSPVVATLAAVLEACIQTAGY